MPLDDSDRRFLERCLTLARRGRGRVSPNPMVGAVLTRRGEVLAEGHHRRVGGPHAEIDALERIAANDATDARGATLYVNLEPCCHHGRTPPCVDRIVEAGIARVVCCHRDPDPKVAGAGFARLVEAGIEVAVGGPVRRAVELNLPFLTARSLGRVAVTLKWAMSLDGKIATRGGDSQWISSPAGRRWAVRLRDEHDAILVGSGTVLADDPRLTRRSPRSRGDIVRVVLDRRLRTPPGAALFAEAGPVLIFTEAPHDGRHESLQAAGPRVEVIMCQAVEPLAVARELCRRGLNSLLVEGGGEILEAFRSAGAFDRVAVCVAPRLIGGREAASAFAGVGAERLEDASRLAAPRVSRAEGDVLLHALRRGVLDDLVRAVGEPAAS